MVVFLCLLYVGSKWWILLHSFPSLSKQQVRSSTEVEWGKGMLVCESLRSQGSVEGSFEISDHE